MWTLIGTSSFDACVENPDMTLRCGWRSQVVPSHDKGCSCACRGIQRP